MRERRRLKEEEDELPQVIIMCLRFKKTIMCLLLLLEGCNQL
jgi:hypothetical protein